MGENKSPDFLLQPTRLIAHRFSPVRKYQMQQSFFRLTVDDQDTIGFLTPETSVGEKKIPEWKWGRSAAPRSPEICPPPTPDYVANKARQKNKFWEFCVKKCASKLPVQTLRQLSFGTPCSVGIDQRQRQPDRSCAAEPEISDRKLASSEHHFEQLLDQAMVPLACRLPLLACSRTASCRPCVARRGW